MSRAGDAPVAPRGGGAARARAQALRSSTAVHARVARLHDARSMARGRRAAGRAAPPHRPPLAPRRAQSLDGEYLASGQQGGRGERSGDAWVYVWSYAQRVPIYRLQGLKGKAEAVAFSRWARHRARRRAAVGGRGARSACVSRGWVGERPSAAPFRPIRAPFRSARRGRVCRDNRFIAGSDEERRLLVWDLQNGQLVNGSQHEAPISCIAWGPVLARESRRGAARPSSYKLAVGEGQGERRGGGGVSAAMKRAVSYTHLPLPTKGIV